MFFKKDKAAAMSLPQTEIVHGVEIRKVPVGKYIEYLKQSENLPAVILNKCFPEQSLDDIYTLFLTANRETVLYVAGRLAATAPEMIIETLCGLLELDYEKALATWTPTQMLDIGRAFWKANDLTDFFGSVWAIIQAKLPTLNTGSKNGSPSPKA